MRGASEAARRIGTSTWFLGTLVFIASWGGGLVAPVAPQIDHSAHAGFNMAAVHGLDFGPDILWTYGPLGFLKSYLVFYPGPARVAALYGFAIHLALSISLVWAIRRNFGALVALGLAFLTASLCRGDLSATAVRSDATVVVLALIWAVAALSPASGEWTRKLLVFGGGPFAALELLTKLNTGIVVLAVVAIAAIAIEGDRRRNLLVFTASLAGSLAVLWLASGQALDGIGGFLSGAAEIVSGYSSGMRMDFGTEERAYDYLLAPALVVATGVIAWISTAGLTRPRRAAILLIVAVATLTTTKSAFVSHDVLHMATVYPTLLGICVALPLPPRVGVRIGALVATVAAAVATFTTEIPGFPLMDPLENARNGVETVAVLADGGRLEREIADNRAGLVAAYAIDPRSLAVLEDRRVHVDPSEAAAAWAYRLDWHPLPVFQPYLAWTEELDRRNAEVVASPDGPERVLRQNLNAIGRYPGFESPAAMIEMLCHFEPLRTTTGWQVLGRVPSRCGEPRFLGSADGAYGEPIVIPRAPRRSAVFARVHGVQVEGLERLRSALYRARSRQVTFDTDERLFTFVPATAADGLLLRAPASVDPPGPFKLAPNAGEVTFLLERGAADEGIEVDFYSLGVRP